MNKYKAKKLCAGSYLYRGFKLELCVCGHHDPYWRVEWPRGICTDGEQTLREAKRRADLYHLSAEKPDSGLSPRDVEDLMRVRLAEAKIAKTVCML